MSEIKKSGRVICWFSCGAASAFATKLTLDNHENVEIYYSCTGSEHEDNIRFLKDCEKWFGQKINILRSSKFNNIWEVFDTKKFLVSPKGAPCTGALKKEPANGVWKLGDVEVFGYTSEEKSRLDRWRKDNPERIISCPLIDYDITKSDCLGMLQAARIELPAMYKMGFSNNNCIACVKARDNINYWKRIRKYFPEEFARMAKNERKYNFALNRRQKNYVRKPVFLDEIEPGDPKGKDVKITCGLFCMDESKSFSDNNDEEINKCF